MSDTQHLEPRNTDAAASRDLRLHAFSNYPELADWCRQRVPATAQRHFAMGHGKVFVALIDFMGMNARADISLLAFSDTAADGRSERLRFVYACVKSGAAAVRQLPADAVLLYEHGD